MLIDNKEVKVSILSCMIILTLFSNLCSIVAILCRRRKVSRMYYFLLNLSVADLLTAFLTLLPELVTTLTAPEFVGGDVACRVVKFLQMVAPYLSSYILVVMAVDRFQTICYPILYRTWKPGNSRRKIAFAWLMALLFCLPQVLAFGGKEDDQGRMQCVSFLGTAKGWRARSYVTWFCLSSFFLPLSALSFCYANICSEIRKNLDAKQQQQSNIAICVSAPLQKGSECLIAPVVKNVNMVNVVEKASGNKACSMMAFLKRQNSQTSLSLNGSSLTLTEDFRPRAHSVEGITRAKIKSIKQTVIIIMGYIVCSSLAVGFQLWAVWIRQEEEEGKTYSIDWFFWLVTWNSILNPWIYILLNRDLQKSLKEFFCPCCKKPSQISHSRRISVERHNNTIPSINTNSSSHNSLFRARANTTDLNHLTVPIAQGQLKRSLSVVREERSGGGLSHVSSKGADIAALT